MSRSECLALIAESWPDVAPAGVRAGVPLPRRPGAAEPSLAAPPSGVRFAHEIFAAQAARHPGAPAIVSGRTVLTYRELEESANRLAHYLAGAGVTTETVVGVCLERGTDLIRAMLAVMKAGGAYLPLDPSLPAARLGQICSQLRPAAVIAAGTAICSAAGLRPVPLGDIAPSLARLPGTPPDIRPRPDNVCYTICTSGTAGDPKPVAVSYANLACVMGEVAREYRIGRDDRVAQVATTAFDTAVEQVFVTLTRGAALVLPPPGTMAPSDLLRGIERKRVSVIDLTPAYWHQILALIRPADERLRSVRLMITGGDRADPADCRAALRAAPWARLLNAYGLTETGITSALYDVGDGFAAARPAPSLATVPVGRPVSRARIMVLDEQLDTVPTGTMGEIYIGGCGVARGYPGRPGLTAERFVPDTGGAPGGRMYRTGDIGRWREDGNLEVAGRADRQLKVRGFRVDPGEIESALAEHPDVGSVLVAATAHSSGSTRLVAYYTLRREMATGAPVRQPSPASLRRHLLDRLPGYMIPATFIPRQELPAESGPGPETEQGPGRSAALRRMRSGRGRDGTGPAYRDAREQRTPAEDGLSALWSRLLRHPHVSLDDDFFAIGGNSLLAAEMLAHTLALFDIPADRLRPLTRRLLGDSTLRGFAAAAMDASAGRLDADREQPAADFGREAALGVKVRLDALPSRPRPQWRGPREILLTGATGFLGAHLLSDLLASTGARVWCLVRGRDPADAMRRIAGAAVRYELPVPAPGRVVPLPGDLSAPRLGLSDAAFRDLARGADIIYHAGALVNVIYPYQELRAANVAGTREVVRLAGLYRGIPVHYVSSAAVLAGLGAAGVRAVTEETPLAYPEWLMVGYLETKYVAEELLANAGRAGLPVTVYRPLGIIGSARTGLWNTATVMCALIRFMTDTGLAPDIDLPLDLVAADVCAAVIRHISLSEAATGRAYHLGSPGPAQFSALADALRNRGYRIAAIPYADWVPELIRSTARDPSHPMAAFLPLFVDREPASGRTAAEMYVRNVFPSRGRRNTERALRGSGIAFPPVSGALLERNIDRLIETGYLPSPSGSRLPAHAD